MPKIVQVIVATDKRGTGTDGDPVRRIPQLFTLKGDLICEYDDIAEHGERVYPDTVWKLLED